MTKPYIPYHEKLKNPKWQKRRLEIMELRKFTCEECASTEKTLNIHHRFYRKGEDPWDYEDYELQCLCGPCHEEKERLLDELKKQLGLFDIDGLKDLSRTLFPIITITPWSHKNLCVFLDGLYADIKSGFEES